MTVNAANRTLVLGGGTTGVAVAEYLLRDNDHVLFLDSDPDAIESADELGVTAEAVEITSGRALEAGLPDEYAVGLAIVAAEPDSTALLLGQLAKTKLAVGSVLALVTDPQNGAEFETAGMIPVCRTTALAEVIAATTNRLLTSDSAQSPRPSASPSTADDSRPGSPV